MRLIIISLLAVISAGCQQTVGKYQDRPIQSEKDCIDSEYCTVKGVVEIREIAHVKMGEIALPDGTCVNLSLPVNIVEDIRKNPRHERYFVGQVMPSFFDFDVDISSVFINDRRVGASICGNYIIFVSD